MGRPGITSSGSVCGTEIIDLVGRERQERGDTGAFDGVLQLPLVQRARSGDAARKDLPALRDELLQHLHVFVVDVFELLHAELADALAAVEELLLSALLSPPTARSPRTPASGLHFHVLFLLL